MTHDPFRTRLNQRWADIDTNFHLWHSALRPAVIVPYRSIRRHADPRSM